MIQTPIENLIVVEEAHLSDPMGNVERRLATITEDRQQVERNPLEVPSPKASEIVRNWPDAMWGKGAARSIYGDGSVHFCAIGIVAEVDGFDWSLSEQDPNAPYAWFKETYGVEDLHPIYCANDQKGKQAAADCLASLGL